MKLSDKKKNIVLTGISRGLGLATARQLLQQDCRVYGISRSRSEDLAALQVQYPNDLFLLQADLSAPQLIDSEEFQHFLPSSIPIYGLINNAARAYDDLVSNLQLDPLANVFALNVFTPMLLCRYVIRNMLLHQTKGSIIHLSSISTQTGYKGLAMYAATKGALEAFSKNLAREWGSRGIRSNCIVAGFMETEMTAVLDDNQKQRIYKRTSLKTATDLSSVVETIQLLLFGGQSITGQNIVVDAGTI